MIERNVWIILVMILPREENPIAISIIREKALNRDMYVRIVETLIMLNIMLED